MFQMSITYNVFFLYQCNMCTAHVLLYVCIDVFFNSSVHLDVAYGFLLFFLWFLLPCNLYVTIASSYQPIIIFFGLQMLEKVGKTEKTTDDNYTEFVVNFNKQQVWTNTLCSNFYC